MSTQFNDYGEIVERDQDGDVPTVGGYAVESGAQQMGLFGSGAKPMVSVRGYKVAAHKRRPRTVRESGQGEDWANWLTLYDPAAATFNAVDWYQQIKDDAAAKANEPKGPTWWNDLLGKVSRDLAEATARSKATEGKPGEKAAAKANEKMTPAEVVEELSILAELKKMGIDASVELALLDELTPAELKQIHGSYSKKAARKQIILTKAAAVPAGLKPGGAGQPSYAWIPWTIGIFAFAWWLSGTNKGS